MRHKQPSLGVGDQAWFGSWGGMGHVVKMWGFGWARGVCTQQEASLSGCLCLIPSQLSGSQVTMAPRTRKECL